MLTRTHTFTWLQRNSVASLLPYKSQEEAAALFSAMGANSVAVGWMKWSQSQGLRPFQPPPGNLCFYFTLQKIAQVINMQTQHREYYVIMCCFPSNLNFTYRENTEDLQIHRKTKFKCLQPSKHHQVFVSPVNAWRHSHLPFRSLAFLFLSWLLRQSYLEEISLCYNFLVLFHSPFPSGLLTSN